MDRLEALSLLELGSDATTDMIERRYEMLLRRYRMAQDDASRHALEAATTAYNTLKNPSIPAASPSPRDTKRYFGRTRADWANRWHYDKWLWLGSLAAAGIIVYIIMTAVNYKPVDFKIVAIGRFAYKDETIWQEQVSAAFSDSVVSALQPNHPDVDTVEYEAIALYLNEDGSLAPSNDPTLQQNLLMKAVARLGADTLDVLILDRGAYATYAAQAAFVDLSDLVDQLKKTLPPDEFSQLGQLTLTPEGEPAAISGLDLTYSGLIEQFGLKAESAIVVIGPRSHDAALAAEWLYSFISKPTP